METNGKKILRTFFPFTCVRTNVAATSPQEGRISVQVAPSQIQMTAVPHPSISSDGGSKNRDHKSKRRRRSSLVRGKTEEELLEVVEEVVPLYTSRFQRIKAIFDFLLHFIELFPFELIGYLAGMRTYLDLRAFRLVRIRMYFSYWNEITEYFYQYNILISKPIQRVYFLVITMAVVAHVFACGWYGMAILVMKRGFSQSWLAKDGIAYLDPETRELVLTKSIAYRYLRAMYWSVQTLDTVGFGDVTAHSETETWFCILFFYISAFLIYSSIANLMTVVADMDSSKTKSLIKESQFSQYASARKIPLHLSQRVKSYFDYQYQ